MNTPAPLTWTNARITIADVEPWTRNPRAIKTENARRLSESYRDFGEVEPIIVGPQSPAGKYPLYNGHSRVSVLKREHGTSHEIDVRIASRPLSEKEREKLTIFLHKGATGEFDFDQLANEFDLDELLDWGFSEKELQLIAPKEKDAPDVLLDQAIQLEPARDYVLVMCETDEEFTTLRALLNLQAVRRGGYKPGSPFDDVGVERVIRADRLIALLDHKTEYVR